MAPPIYIFQNAGVGSVVSFKDEDRKMPKKSRQHEQGNARHHQRYNVYFPS